MDRSGLHGLWLGHELGYRLLDQSCIEMMNDECRIVQYDLYYIDLHEINKTKMIKDVAIDT